MIFKIFKFCVWRKPNRNNRYRIMFSQDILDYYDDEFISEKYGPEPRWCRRVYRTPLRGNK